MSRNKNIFNTKKQKSKASIYNFVNSISEKCKYTIEKTISGYLTKNKNRVLIFIFLLAIFQILAGSFLILVIVKKVPTIADTPEAKQAIIISFMVITFITVLFINSYSIIQKTEEIGKIFTLLIKNILKKNQGTALSKSEIQSIIKEYNLEKYFTEKEIEEIEKEIEEY